MKYEIGKKIRSIRESRGLTQKDLAKAIGVSNSRISNWEQGINRPDADILTALCRELHVSADELLDTGERVNSEKPSAIPDEGLSEIAAIFGQLSADNRAKLLELGRLFLTSQRNSAETK